MPVQIRTPNKMREHTAKVRKRAECHAPDVSKVWPALLGYCAIYSDTPDYEARGTDGGQLGLQSFVVINGKRISFTYRRNPNRVDVAHNATLLAQFDNNSTLDEIYRFFESL